MYAYVTKFFNELLHVFCTFVIRMNGFSIFMFLDYLLNSINIFYNIPTLFLYAILIISGYGS